MIRKYNDTFPGILYVPSDQAASGLRTREFCQPPPNTTCFSYARKRNEIVPRREDVARSQLGKRESERGKVAMGI
ncbi:hypothetical protein L596_028774 [Steinernema carpocapsae]|uniref:Uncharacterized protein n=1 Tax=Steinernema carpocapsae TaxID=34508 RepID=A0A4U5LZC0_STECR|nr:hypothetical protein L596_028774 [Steinernema carpocapsae]